MAINTLSNNIYVFPTANRPYHDPAGRLTTEYNLTSILNRLLDTEGFVITKNNISTDYEPLPLIPSNSTNSNPIKFEFNLHGYFFHLLDIKTIIESSNFSDFNSGDELMVMLALKENNAQDQAGGQEIYKNQLLQTINGEDEISSEDNQHSNRDKYTGLSFYITRKTNGKIIDLTNTNNNDISDSLNNNYWLSLLTYREADSNTYPETGWYITESSKIKFKTTTIDGEHSRSISIDDGILK